MPDIPFATLDRSDVLRMIPDLVYAESKAREAAMYMSGRGTTQDIELVNGVADVVKGLVDALLLAGAAQKAAN